MIEEVEDEEPRLGTLPHDSPHVLERIDEPVLPSDQAMPSTPRPIPITPEQTLDV